MIQIGQFYDSLALRNIQGLTFLRARESNDPTLEY